ncbi:MAG: 4Fe-4S binding protein [Myxococcales bacterium]|nr:4Fe-4S binding protein [Myxococcales bacterium]MCB9752678.1 4Fe-4S binding protein [Myxococcales bacterium]
MRWRKRDYVAAGVRHALRVGVLLFVTYAAFGGVWRNYKVAHNSARLVSLMEGDRWGSAYAANEQLLSTLGEPYRASLDFLGMPWSATVLGVNTTDPILNLAHIVATGSLQLTMLLGSLVAILLAVALGKLFCSYLCPMRLLFEIGQLIRGGLLWLETPLPNLRSKTKLGGWVLLGGLLATLTAGTGVWFLILPYLGVTSAIFVAITAGAGAGLLVIPILWWWVDVLVAPGFFCRNICPQGFLLGLLGRASLLKLRTVRQTPCPSGCRTCQLVCPYGLNPREGTHTPDCDNCGRCVPICPKRKLGRRVRLPVIASSLAALLLAPAAALAHHNKGLPHYGYYENYPQVPVEENIVVDGRWEMGATLFNFQGLDRRTADTPNDVKFFIYVYDLELDGNYQGAIDFEIVDESGEVVSSFSRARVDEELLYSTRETLPATGDYELVAHLVDLDDAPEVHLSFHVDLNQDAVSWLLLLALTGPLVPLFILVALGRTRRGRSKRMKEQLAELADVAEESLA